MNHRTAWVRDKRSSTYPYSAVEVIQRHIIKDDYQRHYIMNWKTTNSDAKPKFDIPAQAVAMDSNIINTYFPSIYTENSNTDYTNVKYQKLDIIQNKSNNYNIFESR